MKEKRKKNHKDCPHHLPILPISEVRKKKRKKRKREGGREKEKKRKREKEKKNLNASCQKTLEDRFIKDPRNLERRKRRRRKRKGRKEKEVREERRKGEKKKIHYSKHSNMPRVLSTSERKKRIGFCLENPNSFERKRKKKKKKKKKRERKREKEKKVKITEKRKTFSTKVGSIFRIFFFGIRGSCYFSVDIREERRERGRKGREKKKKRKKRKRREREREKKENTPAYFFFFIKRLLRE